MANRRTPAEALTDRQQRLLDLMIECPTRTVRELQALSNTSSTSVVEYNLLVLERMGYLERGPRGLARSWRLAPGVARPDPAARVIERARFWAAHDPALAEAIREWEAGQ